MLYMHSVTSPLGAAPSVCACSPKQTDSLQALTCRQWSSTLELRQINKDLSAGPVSSRENIKHQSPHGCKFLVLPQVLLCLFEFMPPYYHATLLATSIGVSEGRQGEESYMYQHDGTKVADQTSKQWRGEQDTPRAVTSLYVTFYSTCCDTASPVLR